MNSAGDFDELELLFEISGSLHHHADFRDALREVLTLLETRAGFREGMVTLLDRETGLLKVREAPGMSPGEKSRLAFRLGEGPLGKVFESGMALELLEEDSLSFFCVPIAVNAGSRDSGFIGTLSVKYPREHDGGALSGNRRIIGLLEKTAALLSDSLRLREQLAGTKAGFPPCDKNAGIEIRGGLAPGIGGSGGIIGTHKAIQDVFNLIRQVAPSDATVLISGESGTGKELAATELFRLSKRGGAPFIKINCAALPESIIESELFGHEKGAFTGALHQRKGRFELAQGGTVFLDEIGDLSPQVQVKLLRVLEEREFERVGGNKTIKVDVRLIAATNRNLDTDVKNGRFREDLFYRLNVFPLRLPPLRERKSDIILLADFFTEKYGAKNAKTIKRISTPAIDLLTSYSWPGNVRELENCIERAVILSTDMVIHSYDLPPSLQSAVSTRTEPGATLEAALSRLEKELVVEALKITSGNTAAAARRLGITERQMGLRLRHYGINWRLYRDLKQLPL